MENKVELWLNMEIGQRKKNDTQIERKKIKNKF